MLNAMKKVFLLISVFSIITIWSCEKKTTNEDAKMDSSAVQYACPMHPEEMSDKAGTCPKCGMEMMKKPSGEQMEIHKDTTMHKDSTMKM
jgi:hypothetical protein